MDNELIKRILSSIILIPMALFFIIEGSIFFIFFILSCFLIAIYEWHTISKKKLYFFLGLVFLIFSFYSIYNLRNEFDGDYLYLLFVTTICISTDIGGYVFGKTFKGPKLTKISPKKTYAGMIGSFFLSVISIIFFLDNPYLYRSLEFSNKMVIFVILVSIVSQLGDIFISYFKRKSKIKNTGNIIPGHGGFLDRVDGMLFAFPFSYILLTLGFINFF
mgnify:CR=1 FL=1